VISSRLAAGSAPNLPQEKEKRKKKRVLERGAVIIK
jgi:hypothetical protein